MYDIKQSKDSENQGKFEKPGRWLKKSHLGARKFCPSPKLGDRFPPLLLGLQALTFTITLNKRIGREAVPLRI